MRRTPLDKGNDDAACNNAENTGPAYPIRKSIPEHHPDKNGVDNICITKNGNNSSLIRTIGSCNKILPEQCSQRHEQ